MICDDEKSAAIDIRNIYLWVSVQVRLESDMQPIESPGGIAIKYVVLGQLLQVCSVCIDYEYFPITIEIGMESKLCAVWGPDRNSFI